MHARRQGRWAFALTSASLLWALALIPAAFLLPVFGTGESSPVSGPGGTQGIEVQHGGATLIAVNGASLRLLILIALPAALAALAWSGLHQLCAHGRMWGRRVATVAVVALALLTVLTGFSIGIEMLPALGLLVVGRAMTPAGASA